MKTVVIGPRGIVYLTDGHHTFSTFWEADGGRNHPLQVWVKVSAFSQRAGRSGLSGHACAENKVWLKNGRNQAIAPQQLPSAIGLHAGRRPVPLARLLYARDGYEPPEHATEFLEFYWADWLRGMPAPDLARVDLRDPVAYANAILLAAQAMVALRPGDIVSGGRARASWARGTRSTAKRWMN
jgi:hypothetical protein